MAGSTTKLISYWKAHSATARFIPYKDVLRAFLRALLVCYIGTTPMVFYQGVMYTILTGFEKKKIAIMIFYCVMMKLYFSPNGNDII